MKNNVYNVLVKKISSTNTFIFTIANMYSILKLIGDFEKKKSKNKHNKLKLKI